MKAFKVVGVSPKGTRHSFTQVPKRFEVEYKEGEWATANEDAFNAGYGLCVFKSAGDAEVFTGSPWFSGEVWECETEGELDKLPPRGYLNIYSAIESSGVIDIGSAWPLGTMMVKKVKLTRRVR